MKSIDSSPNSSLESSSSSTPTTVATSSESEPKDSNYFPGCRKDANCNCEICIASINATLDLMPQSVQRSTLTKISSSKSRSPVSFNPLSPITPKSRIRSAKVPKPLNYNVGSSFEDKLKRKKKKKSGIRVSLFRVILCLSFCFAAEFGFPWMVSSGGFHPKLSADMVRNLGEKSLLLGDLTEKMSFLKEELWHLTNKNSSNRSSVDSVWQINQDGLLLNSKHELYRSMTEEVSIWGWPLQTAGLLTAEFSSRSFTILSGRLTEWQNGEVVYAIRTTNESWFQGKWSASPVQLDPNTWILEYRQSAIMENSRLISALLELLKFRLTREIKKIQQEFWWRFSLGESQCSQFTTNPRIPT